MKYIIQLILLLIVIIASSRAKKNARKALILKKVEWGRYMLNPLTGEKAERLAKISILLSNIAPWSLILIYLLYDLLF